MLVALAGGVGAARFLRGLVGVVPPEDVTAIVNTADDDTFHGLHVSPDIDSVVYTLAGASDPVRGWGLEGESYTVLDSLERYGAETWFRLGDRDLATHLYRTERLREGATISTVTAEIAAAWGVRSRLLPMTDQSVSTRIEVEGSGGRPIELRMQEWFVRERCEPTVLNVGFDGADVAVAAPGVLEALESAETILICPSNPVISIGPILAIPGVREVLASRRRRVVGVSPIVGGAPVRGPADRLMRALGIEVTCAGVARTYSEICGTLVIDAVDEALAPRVEAAGVRAVVADTLMRSPEVAAGLARNALEAVA
ncbi:MAG: 2-phospho-L-lactate transferase [Acidimicrobiia bacterium]|nr:2-phospho-L-lactate transferase [Acidimicrobiia bacterium]